MDLNTKIKGALIGAAIGAELGFTRTAEEKRFQIDGIDTLDDIDFSPVKEYQPEHNRIYETNSLPLIDVGVKAYLAKRERATPETFGEIFRDDPGISFPAFTWDGLHTVQEILKEGMNPRISGLHTCPCGFICGAMPAVGIYHFANPEYAYLDGVELASVAQARHGADWAGLCAVAVAAAFKEGVTGEEIVQIILKTAFENNRKLFYELDSSKGKYARYDESEFIDLWLKNGGAPESRNETRWLAYNPISFVIPLLERFSNNPEKLMKLQIAKPDYMRESLVSGVISGTVVGALHGPDAFPDEWRKWAEPIAQPWFGLNDVVEQRLAKEKKIISVTEKMAESKQDDISLLKEKLSGCILAGAIGNAMGSPVEGRTYKEIDEKYPDAITTVLEPKCLESEDDNQMAMLLVETYIDRKGLPVMARHFGKTWKERLDRHHYYPFCMGHACDLICEGQDPRIIGHWSVVTGSTVMCMEPVGIYHLADPDYAAVDATAVSYMYQRGLDVTAAAMLAATVAEAFRPEATVDSICQAALDVAPRENFNTFDERPFNSCYEYLETCLEIANKYTDVLEARAELYEKCLLYHHIDPLELWGLSLAMFKIADGDVRQSAIGGTNIGRDSDTIGGRTAMLAGTLKGMRNVPQEWLDLFKPETLEKIYHNADRLVDLVVNRKLPSLKDRQAV